MFLQVQVYRSLYVNPPRTTLFVNRTTARSFCVTQQVFVLAIETNIFARGSKGTKSLKTSNPFKTKNIFINHRLSSFRVRGYRR